MNAKRIIAIVVVILFMGSMAYSVPATNNNGPGDILGQGKLDSQASKIFRLVRYEPASATNDSKTLTSECIVIWDTTSDDGVTVTTTVTSGDNAVAGVIVATTLTPEQGAIGQTAAQDSGKRNWTWLQTYGYCKVLASDALTTAVGDKIGTSTHRGFASTFTQTGTMSGGVSGWAGMCYDAESSDAEGAEVEVFLKGLD